MISVGRRITVYGRGRTGAAAAVIGRHPRLRLAVILMFVSPQFFHRSYGSLRRKEPPHGEYEA